LSSSEFTQEGVPVLAIGNVQWGYLDTHELNYVSHEKASQLSRYRVQPGDILFARMGTVGRSCVVPDFAKDWLISYHLIRITADRSACDPQFMFYALRGSPSVLEAIEEKTRGSTRAGVNSTILRQLEFPLPPLDEQRRIVTHLDGLQAQVDELTALQEATQAELDALLPSVLDRAFRREL
jgi:type I restriction enzyme S subunit